MSQARHRLIRIAAPALVAGLLLGLWEWLVIALEIPRFLLPAPSAIGSALLQNWPTLQDSLIYTAGISATAFAWSTAGGIGLAILFARSRIVELAFFPYAVTLQVTPIVAIAPLIIIWTGVDHVDRAVLILAVIIGFFPVLQGTLLGLKSVDSNLRDLFRLYQAGPMDVLFRLELPSALPHILGGMKVGGGLSLIGAVMAEFVAGSGAAPGLAWRIMEAGNRLQVEKMFAALALLSALGISVFLALSLIEWLALRRWHESQRAGD